MTPPRSRARAERTRLPPLDSGGYLKEITHYLSPEIAPKNKRGNSEELPL